MPDNHERRGMTIEYLREKRQALLDELHSDEHYEQTESVVFGDHDPFDVPVVRCEQCSGKPRMTRVSERPIRWASICECGRRAKPNRQRPWQGALEWNCINLLSSDYRALPLFGLAQLSPKAAHRRLTGIRRNLELRKNILGLTRNIGQRTREMEVPGKKFQERIEAYLQWCLWGLRMTKIAVTEEARNGSGVDEYAS